MPAKPVRVPSKLRSALPYSSDIEAMTRERSTRKPGEDRYSRFIGMVERISRAKAFSNAFQTEPQQEGAKLQPVDVVRLVRWKGRARRSREEVADLDKLDDMFASNSLKSEPLVRSKSSERTLDSSERSQPTGCAEHSNASERSKCSDSSERNQQAAPSARAAGESESSHPTESGQSSTSVGSEPVQPAVINKRLEFAALKEPISPAKRGSKATNGSAHF